MKLFTLKKLALATIASVAVTQGAAAATLTLNFDNVASGANANTAVPTGISFFNAAYLNDLDEYGDEILHTEKFRIDPTATDPVVVLNPSTVDYGPAPSANNALDARWSPLLMHFNTAINLTAFSVTLDNSTYGDLSLQHLLFLDANKSILGELVLDETQPGFVGNWTGDLHGVQEILLPSSAFYDNLSITSPATVPLPAALPLLMSGFGLLGGLGRLRRRFAKE